MSRFQCDLAFTLLMLAMIVGLFTTAVVLAVRS